MRVQSLEALDKAAAQLERGLKLVLDASLVAAKRVKLDELKSHLKAAPGAGSKGGEVRLLLPLDDQGREIELTLSGRYDVSPSQAGHLSTVHGVLEVLET